MRPRAQQQNVIAAEKPRRAFTSTPLYIIATAKQNAIAETDTPWQYAHTHTRGRTYAGSAPRSDGRHSGDIGRQGREKRGQGSIQKQWLGLSMTSPRGKRRGGRVRHFAEPCTNRPTAHGGMQSAHVHISRLAGDVCRVYHSIDATADDTCACVRVHQQRARASSASSFVSTRRDI